MSRASAEYGSELRCRDLRPKTASRNFTLEHGEHENTNKIYFEDTTLPTVTEHSPRAEARCSSLCRRVQNPQDTHHEGDPPSSL